MLFRSGGEFHGGPFGGEWLEPNRVCRIPCPFAGLASGKSNGTDSERAGKRRWAVVDDRHLLTVSRAVRNA